MDLDEDEQLQRRCRYLATAFGFGQGCCVNVYLSAGGYLGDKFQDKYFFVWMCAAVYVTPLLIFALARRLDPYFDRHFGFRKVYQVRLAISMLLGALLVAGLIVPTLSAGGQVAILTLGAAVGMVAGSVASASAQFFGVRGGMLGEFRLLDQLRDTYDVTRIDSQQGDSHPHGTGETNSAESKLEISSTLQTSSTMTQHQAHCGALGLALQ
eukprot:symbB.v1.2.015498.t1/scaffold1160.1/size134679/7